MLQPTAPDSRLAMITSTTLVMIPVMDTYYMVCSHTRAWGCSSEGSGQTHSLWLSVKYFLTSSTVREVIVLLSNHSAMSTYGWVVPQQRFDHRIESLNPVPGSYIGVIWFLSWTHTILCARIYEPGLFKWWQWVNSLIRTLNRQALQGLPLD